jgi:DNA-binding transcriptional regulator YhcF (GntR family)
MIRKAVTDDLRGRIVNGLHVGRYRGGERLPSVRTLAREFDVNERVVLAAIHALAAEGFVELRQRSGAFIVPPHRPTGDALPRLGFWLINTLLQARALGLPPVAVDDFVRRRLRTRRVRAACIECNEDQLHLLCSELAEDHGFATESVHLEELNAASPPPALRRADVLITTASHAPRVRQVGRVLGKPWIAVRLRSDVMATVGDHLRHGPVYYVATDPAFERKLRRMVADVGLVANLRFILLGRDDIADIPPDAPTFVMPSARAWLTPRVSRKLPGQPIHPVRHFSDDSAKELLTFLIRANMTPSA